MAILDADIQVLKSEVMDDVPEGGGMATGVAVVDGASNNLFPDISELDRTYGRIALRKIHPGVVTDNVDTYYGAHIIVAKPPADSKVSVTLFSTGSWSDRRGDAQNKLESYLSASAEGRWVLYGNHLVGQRTVQMHCAHTALSPAVDDVLMLASADAVSKQYVRVSRFIGREDNVLFEDSKGSFYRDIITLEISDTLRYQFFAAPLERYTAAWFEPPTRIHTVIAADAASYYGVQPLAIAASLGDLTVKAASIYTQLVPSALAETPIIDARCASDRMAIVPITGGAALTFSTTLTSAAGASAVRYFGRAIGRGSVAIVLGGVTVVDDGDGALVDTSGYSGSVDYEAGSVAIARTSAMSALPATFSAAPACAISIAGHTDATAITINNRRYSHVKALQPVPAPGSVIVSYMAQGKWYSLYDDGVGAMVGDEGTGGGSVNYATGSVLLTLGALPDADTQILYGWGSPVHYNAQVGDSVFDLPSISIEIDGGALEPGSLSIDYTAGGAAKTVADNGAGGLTGDGTGYVDYGNGLIVLRPTVLPDSASSLELAYEQGGKVVEVIPATGAVNNFSLANAVKPASLSLVVLDTAGMKHTLRDTGAGVLVRGATKWYSQPGGLMTTTLQSASNTYGTVDYATGDVSLAVSLTITQQYQTGVTWSSSSSTAVATGAITATYRVAGDNAGGVQNRTVAVPEIKIDLLPTVANALVPGSLSFTLAGDTYVDRAGRLVKNPSHTTNSGSDAGAVNYSTGVITLTDYTGGGASSVAVSALTRRGVWVDWRLRFRTAAAPLQSGSLYVSANDADTGSLLSGTAAANGTISGSLVDGQVDVPTGICTVRFGQLVTAAGHENEWWYNADDVVGGEIWQPLMILPDTAKYNAVATSSLPLSSAILGLDPVRLPVDGRVPIFRPGDVAVIHHAGVTAPQVVANGQMIDVGRERLARARVIGADGATITAGYSHDLDAGVLTFNDVTGYSQPVSVEHRIEDMALISDVQINGELRLTRSLTHDFPIGSFVSSALIIGDLHARVSDFFDQQTWTGWFDTPQGGAATGTYNKTQYPPVVTNRGAINERWAIIFTNTTTVNVIGETVGQILTGAPISQLIAPINPAQGVPYFSLDPRGWGAGWSAGNVLRPTTVAANFPVWCARTTLQGNPTVNDDQFTLGVRGDIDA